MSIKDYRINLSDEEFRQFKWMYRVKDTASQRLRRALEQCVSPSCKPLKGRTVFLHDANSSFFYEVHTVDDLMALVEMSVLEKIRPGANRTLALVFNLLPFGVVGKSVRTCAFKSRKYRIELVDGRLQPVGPVKTKREDECYFTLVLTPRKGKDGIGKFVLTDAFPGTPEELPVFDGLKEGDVISGSEVMKRGLRPTGPETGKPRQADIPEHGTSLDEMRNDLTPGSFFAEMLDCCISGALNDAESFNASLPQNMFGHREESNPVFGYVPDSSTSDISCFYPLEKIYGAIAVGKQPAKFADYFEISDLYEVCVEKKPSPEVEDPDLMPSWREIVTLERIKPGPAGIVYFIMKYPVPVGESVRRRVDPNAEYRIKRVGKRMIPVGPVELRRQEEKVFTIVLIPRAMADENGKTEYLLMSAFPGLPEEVPDFRGLKDGDVISGAEVITRRLRPRGSVQGTAGPSESAASSGA